jgi:hypothetical protein
MKRPAAASPGETGSEDAATEQAAEDPRPADWKSAMIDGIKITASPKDHLGRTSRGPAERLAKR